MDQPVGGGKPDTSSTDDSDVERVHEALYHGPHGRRGGRVSLLVNKEAVVAVKVLISAWV